VRDDVAGWAAATGIELVSVAEAGGGALEFYLRKR
jgi:hypothetical protein